MTTPTHHEAVLRRRETLARRDAHVAELTSQPLTADAVAQVAKLSTCATPVIAAQVSEGVFRLCLRYEGTGHNAFRLLNIVRDVFIQHGHDATVGREVTSGQIILTVVEASR
jgi:hypothetical protein